MKVVLEIFRPSPTPKRASIPHCFAGGFIPSGRSDKSPHAIRIITLAKTSTGKVLFLLIDKPPPNAQPVAPPAIVGSKRTPAFTGSYKLTIWARSGILMIANKRTNPDKKVSLQWKFSNRFSVLTDQITYKIAASMTLLDKIRKGN